MKTDSQFGAFKFQIADISGKALSQGQMFNCLN